MSRKHIFRHLFSLLVVLCGLMSVAARGSAQLAGDDVRGTYVGSQTSSYSGLNPFLVLDITDQSAYWDTSHGTKPWSHISGTISIDFGPAMAFTGTVRWGGRMDISYWNWDGSGWQNGSYTAWIHDNGYSYDMPGGTYTTDEYIYIPFAGWIPYQIDAGSFYVYQW